MRPEDIQSDSTIDSAKIAEARIAYGGRDVAAAASSRFAGEADAASMVVLARALNLTPK